MKWWYYVKQGFIATIVMTVLEIFSQKAPYSIVEIFLSVLWKMMLIVGAFLIYTFIKSKIKKNENT